MSLWYTASDSYTYLYNPFLNPDNLVIPVGAHLGKGNLVSGLTGRAAGPYDGYATSPCTDNVSNGETQYSIVGVTGIMGIATVASFGTNTTVNQNGAGGDWALLGNTTIKDALNSIRNTPA